MLVNVVQRNTSDESFNVSQSTVKELKFFGVAIKSPDLDGIMVHCYQF